MSNIATDFEEDAYEGSDYSFNEDEETLLFNEDETSLDDDNTFSEADESGEDEEEYSYKVISAEQLVQLMNSYIEEVNCIVETNPTIVRTLLHHFKWDKDKVYEMYFDGDQEKLFREAHITNSHQPSIPQGEAAVVSDDLETCSICYCEYTDSCRLACGHEFCTGCCEEYLAKKIMDEGVGQTILCPAYKCDVVVDDETVMKLVRDVKVKLRYQLLITNSFVQCNRSVQWCPQPFCNNIVVVAYACMQPVTCTCGHTFCFLCSEPWHDPTTCRLLKRWKKKCSDDSETQNWLASNTKECPSCGTPIEKNGGCNHMTCTNMNCKTEFCWVCLELWKDHVTGLYDCNRFNEQKEREAEKSRLALKKYLFFSERYMNHTNSLKFENKLFISIEEIIQQMEDIRIPAVETKFLREAVRTLNRCRRTLIYTYVFAYFVSDNNQSRIFVDNQSDLESATEKLSEYLEDELNKETYLDLKIKIQDWYRYCEKRRQVLVNHVHEGYKWNWWEFTE